MNLTSSRSLKYLGLIQLVLALHLGAGCGEEPLLSPSRSVMPDEFGLSPAPLASEVGLASSGTWTTAASMAGARYRPAAVRLTSGKVLVTGGYNNARLATTELYDAATNTWSSASSMSDPRYEHTATLLQNGQVLVAGGNNISNLASAELYDPAANTWRLAAPMLMARTNHTATLLNNGKVLVAGWGLSAEVYDPATNTWSFTGAMSVARQSHTATLLSNGKVLVTGGWNGSTYSSTELYDPATNTWALAAPMSTARNDHTATLLPNGKVLVTGGWSDVASAELYDPATNTWAQAGSMSIPRAFHIAALVNGKVLVSGGHTDTYRSASSTADLYDPALNAWTSESPMAYGRTWHVATVLSNGKVLVAGGAGTGVLSSAELYTPGGNDLGSALGTPVAQGGTCGSTNQVTPSCASSNAPDTSFTWTAPSSGSFTFTTAGSNFDTILQISDATTGASLGCNDDSSGTLQSSLTLNLTAGQRLRITADGYSTSCGNFNLNISSIPSIPTASLKLWLRADVGVTSSSGKVSLWQDQSGNGFHASMSTLGRQPTLVTGALNSKPVIRFGGAHSLSFSNLLQLGNSTLFIVAKNNKVAETFHLILGPAGTSANNQLRFENGTQVLFVGTGNNMPAFTSTIGNNRVYHALSTRYNGSVWSVYRDGNLISNHTFTTTGAWDLAQIGAWYSQYFLEGDIAEIIAYDRVLTETERGAVNSYLRSKYQLP